jgi:hypothetical protein
MSDQNIQKALDIIRQAIPETVQSLRDIINDANADETTRVWAASLLRRYLVVLAQLESEVFDG